MSIRKAVAWFFDVGDGREVEALAAARAHDRRQAERRGDAVEDQLYGEAEAIRVLYQTALPEQPPKPPRPKRGLWITRFLDSLSPSLRAPAGAKA